MSNVKARNIMRWRIIGLFLFSSLVFAALGIKEGQDHAALEERGVIARAAIDSVEWKNKRGSGHDYQLRVSFPGPGGLVKAKIPVDNKLGKQALDDDTFKHVDVAFLPEDTSVVRLVGAPNRASIRHIAAGLLGLTALVLVALRLTINPSFGESALSVMRKRRQAKE
jgi:hypothetical protein